MAFAVSDLPITDGHLTLPARGVWHASLSLAADTPPAVGSSVTLQIGSLTLAGTVVRAGSHASSSEVQIVGGRGGWRRDLKAKNYRADNNVRLSQVVADLATETGETVVLEPGAERALGYAWTRPSGIAATALDEVEPRWWVAPDGVTHVGERPASTRIAAPFSVEEFSPAEERVCITTPEDDLASFPIGGELAGEGIGTFTVRALAVTIVSQTMRIEARARDLPTEIRALIAHVQRATRFYGLYEYRVVEENSGRPTLQIVSAVDGVPDQLSLDKLHGLAGATEQCALSSHVLVGFKGGKPAAPFVAHYLPSTPVQASIDATTLLKLGAALTPALSLQLGGTTGSGPIALATQTAAALTTLATFAAAVVTYAEAVAAIPSFVLTQPAAQALAEAGAALGAALGPLLGNAPTGLVSVRTRSQ